MKFENFVGTWKLVSCEIQHEDGSVVYPHGEKPKGYIMYSSDGYVSVNVPSFERPHFSSSDPTQGAFEELQQAARYIAYAGRYEVFVDHVIHHLDVSFFPNWTGTTLRRSFKFEDNRLTLSGDQMSRSIGKKSIGIMVWERV